MDDSALNRHTVSSTFEKYVCDVSDSCIFGTSAKLTSVLFLNPHLRVLLRFVRKINRPLKNMKFRKRFRNKYTIYTLILEFCERICYGKYNKQKIWCCQDSKIFMEILCMPDRLMFAKRFR